MKDLSFVPFVEKPLLASMTANDTRVYIVERRNSFVGANFDHSLDLRGAVAGDSLVPMPWEDISDPKPGEYVSNLCWTKKLPTDATNK
jgi:hypothetical protein